MSNSYITFARDAVPATTEDRSMAYWAKEAKDIFANYPTVTEVEVVLSGSKSHSAHLKRGNKRAPAGKYVIIASTGGKWGKSRQDYPPAI